MFYVRTNRLDRSEVSTGLFSVGYNFHFITNCLF